MKLEEKYQELLDFTKKLITEHDDDFIFDRESEIKWKGGSPLFKSEFMCVYTRMIAQQTLKKIGEIE